MRDANALQQCYVRVFEGEAGQVVLADLEARAFVRDTSFNPDPQRAAFNEGRRSLMLHIRRMLDHQEATRRLAADGLTTQRDA